VAGCLRVFGNRNDGSQLQNVGITNWDKERLKMSVKMLARW
jgi:hypothetical protein